MSNYKNSTYHQLLQWRHQTTPLLANRLGHALPSRDTCSMELLTSLPLLTNYVDNQWSSNRCFSRIQSCLHMHPVQFCSARGRQRTTTPCGTGLGIAPRPAGQIWLFLPNFGRILSPETKTNVWTHRLTIACMLW